MFAIACEDASERRLDADDERTCAECGTLLPPGALFCGWCGAEAEVEDVPDDAPVPAGHFLG